MIKNKKILLTTMLTSLFIGISNVNAFTTSVGFADTGEGGAAPQREDIIVELGRENNIKYTCTYNYSIAVNNGITINGYNGKNESLMANSLIITEENKILSGTSIGLSIYENKTIKWQVTKAEVTAVATKTQPKYICTYSNSTPPKKPIRPNGMAPVNLKTNSSNVQSIALCDGTATVYGNASCPYRAGCTYVRTQNGYGTPQEEQYQGTIGSNWIETCETKAANAAKTEALKNLGHSYIVSVTDSNDINGTNNMDVEVVTVKRTTTTSGTKEGTENATYVYKKNNVCINVRTSKVTYNKSECNEEEIEIENEIINNEEHWHYFTPLNTKSNQNVELRLHPAAGGMLVEKQCKYVMDHNPIEEGKTSYLDLIVKNDNDGTNFSGNISADTREIKKNGCKLTSKIKINPKQEFYNEVITENNISFKGFNFYYKPIDVNNPFPNGIPDNSIWKEWEKSGTPTLTGPSLNKKNITYIANVTNAKQIRNYTKDNPYTGWENMYLDGRSGFIETEGIVTRYIKKTDIYKLGCGSANKNATNSDGTKNYLYQPECDMK